MSDDLAGRVRQSRARAAARDRLRDAHGGIHGGHSRGRDFHEDYLGRVSIEPVPDSASHLTRAYRVTDKETGGSIVNFEIRAKSKGGVVALIKDAYPGAILAVRARRR